MKDCKKIFSKITLLTKNYQVEALVWIFGIRSMVMVLENGHKMRTSFKNLVSMKECNNAINLYKKKCLPIIAWNKTHSLKQAVPITYTLGKKFLATATFEDL